MVEERIDRRLAAIFAVDVAGYSRLMGADEEGTLRQLKAHRKELVAPTTEVSALAQSGHEKRPATGNRSALIVALGSREGSSMG